MLQWRESTSGQTGRPSHGPTSLPHQNLEQTQAKTVSLRLQAANGFIATVLRTTRYSVN